MAVHPSHRIEFAAAMLIAGRRQQHPFADAATTIPQQWAAFKSEDIKVYQQPVTYGVVCGVSDSAMDYLCGVAVSSFEEAPHNAGRVIIPAQKYAVFVHHGPIAQIGESWQTIYHQLMPQRGLEDAHTPCFERYDERYDAPRGDGVVEIWCPVK